MAAVLNKLNGASSTGSVDAAITSATGFFNALTPAQANALSKQSPVRQSALVWAGVSACTTRARPDLVTATK